MIASSAAPGGMRDHPDFAGKVKDHRQILAGPAPLREDCTCEQFAQASSFRAWTV